MVAAEKPDWHQAALIERIGEHYRQRQMLLTSELSLEKQIGAIQRQTTGQRYTKDALVALADDPVLDEMATERIVPFLASQAGLHRARLTAQRELSQRAEQLPVWPWVESVRGFGAVALGQIVGECGDLSNYSNPAKVWKRMGLAVLPDGTRQRRMAGVSEEEAYAIGYVARRRSVMFSIGKSLMMGNQGGYYKQYYDAEKARQFEKLPDMQVRNKEGKLTNPRLSIADKRALRHMEKRLLKHLWQAWHRQAIDGDMASEQ